MSRAWLLAAALLPALALAQPAPSGAQVVVLRDGTRYTLSKPYEVRGSQARFQLAKGPLVSIPASEIDLEATRLADLPPTPAPQSPATSSPTSSTSKKGSFSIIGGTVMYGAYSGPTESTSSGPSRPKTQDVSGYTRANGKYVAPYTRSAPRAPRKN